MQQKGKNNTFSLSAGVKCLGAIISLALIFGLLGFVYSFFGLLDKSEKNIISPEPFRFFTINEIGGHFLFGFVVGIPLRSIRVSILIGLMALSIDSDHLLNIAAGFPIQTRVDHSIPFAIVSSILMGFIAGKVYFKAPRENDAGLTPGILSISISKIYKNKAREEEEEEEEKQNHTSSIIFGNTNRDNNDGDNDKYNNQNSVFILFSFITLSAYISHIAYDVFVDYKGNFPLLAPFSFNEFVIPGSYGLPIEVVGFLMVLMVYFCFLRLEHTKSRTCNLSK